MFEWSPVFFEALLILLREGLEAILILGAIVAFLSVNKEPAKIRLVYLFAGLGVLASILTAFLLEGLFAASGASQEVLEGTTMLFAAAILLYVTNWLWGKVDSAHWKNYLKKTVHHAVEKNNPLILGLAAFLAVYREGFETVLFFKALTVQSGFTPEILLALGLGFISLMVLFVLIVKLEKRLPLPWVFGTTSALLFLLSIKFAGKGLHELQEAGLISETALAMVPKIADAGLYPTVETVGIQLLVLAVGAVLVYIHFFQKKN